jgi:EmrB/QacA subfamily drug resistance transporter
MNFEISIKKQWIALFLLSLGYATIYLDMTALNVALSSIQSGFKATSTQLFWIVNTYMVTTAVFALAGGRLGDIFGLRNIFIIGVSLFGISSIGCALSFSSGSLIFWRSFQGIGGALTIANAAACIYQIFPKEKQGKAMGYFGLVSVLFIVIGPTVGGIFTEYLNWRWIFWLNPMVGSISCFFIFHILNGLDLLRDKEASFDFSGQFLLSGFMIPTIIAFMQAHKWGWKSFTTINLILIGLFFFVLFIRNEKRQKYPLFDLSLLKIQNFRLAILLFFCSQFASVANVLFALYLEKSLQLKPVIVGFALLPSAFFGFFGNPLAGGLIDKFGVKRVIQIGLFSTLLAFVWLSVTASTFQYRYMFVALLLISISLPLYMVGIFVMAMQSAPANQRGMASGISMTMRQTGGTFAIAFMSLILATCETRYQEFFTPMHTFAKGYSVAMFVIASALGIAFYASFWIGQEKEEKSPETLTSEKTLLRD